MVSRFSFRGFRSTISSDHAATCSLSESNKSSSLTYFITCHESLDFVLFLLSSIYTEVDIFVIHCDPKADLTLKSGIEELCKSFNNVHLLIPHIYSWAGYSQVETSLDAVEFALSVDREWKHFLFLSEQHVPLKGPSFLKHFLEARRSYISSACAADMHEAAKSDIISRFSTNYRELEGVGCFATSLTDFTENMLSEIYHGSNWMIVCREHCSLMVSARNREELCRYKNAVHADEMVFQSILQSFSDEIHNCDTTIVAHPHLTDNDRLVFSDSLFDEAFATEKLFIRKRPLQLNGAIADKIRANHFDWRVAAIRPKKTQVLLDRQNHAAVSAMAEALKYEFTKIYRRFTNFSIVIPQESGTYPLFYIIITAEDLRKDLSVRIISANMLDYKILIMKEDNFDGFFKPSKLDGEWLETTIRARIYGMFLHREVRPLSVSNDGFVHERDTKSIKQVAAVAAHLFQAAITYPQVVEAKQAQHRKN